MADFYELANDREATFVFRADIVLRPDGSYGDRDAIKTGGAGREIRDGWDHVLHTIAHACGESGI